MGKSASKLRSRKHSTNSLTWTRFGSIVSLKSKLRHNEINATGTERRKARKHLDISDWLKVLELEQYADCFAGYDGVEELLEFTESDVKDLGVKIASHRARIMSSLTALSAKYNNNKRPIQRDAVSRHSLAADSGRRIQQCDALSDLRTVSEAIQSKSLNNLIIMDSCMDPITDATALKKALEWELSLDVRDLRSHAWYHGAIPRSRAEDIVREEGGFLVRDCTSQPGNFVLTCRTKQIPLHFVINKIILQPDTVYERVQYQFEDDAFDTVPDLITFYVGSGKSITATSGAKIQFPKNRMYPLSFYATKYTSPLNQSRVVSPATTPVANMQMRCSPINPGTYKPSPSPTRISRDPPPRLPSKKQRSQSLTPSEVNRVAQEKCNSADGVIQFPIMTRSVGADTINSDAKFSTHSLPRSPCTKLSLSPSTIVLGRNSKNIARVTSDPSLSPCAERRIITSEDECAPESPPPKPSRIPSIMRTESKDSDIIDGKQNIDVVFLPHGSLQRVTSYHASGSDSGNGSGDSALSSAAGDPIECNHRNSGVIIKNPRYNITNSESTTTLKNFDFDCKEAEEKLLQMAQPELNLSSRFDLENFQTILLPVHENKPLDNQALKGIKLILKECGSKILANHLTKMDLDLVFGLPDNPYKKLGSGIELCSLPHGHQLRMDLIERTECLKLMVAVTIITCADELERTETLNKWIEVAIDTKTALGNLYGFCGIMLGLCLPQVQKLDSTWHMLRQKYTDAAFNFEAKLRPTLKNMNNCSNPQAPNTTIPHLLPFILLLEKDFDDFLIPNEQIATSLYLNICESNTQDFGLSTLLAHLECARKFLDSLPTFQRNAEIVLAEARMEDLTLDMFKTEFQMKFLWGSRGAFAPAVDRFAKFEQVLDVMVEKYYNNPLEHLEV
uniref:SH2 domain-containing protein n=3 Tax=Photinus pyralis TaxID=7054 RepID=A0A1Y1MWI1_PHOPY